MAQRDAAQRSQRGLDDLLAVQGNHPVHQILFGPPAILHLHTASQGGGQGRAAAWRGPPTDHPAGAARAQQACTVACLPRAGTMWRPLAGSGAQPAAACSLQPAAPPCPASRGTPAACEAASSQARPAHPDFWYVFANTHPATTHPQDEPPKSRLNMVNWEHCLGSGTPMKAPTHPPAHTHSHTHSHTPKHPTHPPPRLTPTHPHPKYTHNPPWQTRR